MLSNYGFKNDIKTIVFIEMIVLKLLSLNYVLGVLCIKIVIDRTNKRVCNGLS